MTIEDALNAFIESDLQVDYQPESDEINFTVRGGGTFVTEGGHTFYRWECWLSKRESECIVEPPPHPWNDPPPAFVVPSLDEAVSLILYMYQHRLPDRAENNSASYAEQTVHTNLLYTEWRKLKGEREPEL